VKASLSTLLAVATLLTLDAGAAPSQSATRFVSAAVGISLDPPPGWEALAVREVAAPQGKARLPDEQLLDAIRALGGMPLVELAKHAEPYPELNPTIQVNVRALGGFAGRPIEELMSTVVIPLRRQHPELELVGPAKQLKISGLKAMHTATAYKLTVGPRQLDVRSDLWVVPRGALLFVIAMTQPPKGPDVAQREFDAALASLRIDP
jgi:hypothetical protein